MQNFKELFTGLNEARRRTTQRRGDEMVTEFQIWKGKELLFTTRASNGADQVERKLKQKKFKDADKVTRDLMGDHEDVTKLFIK